MGRRYFVYILANRRRGVLYMGVTSNLARRMAAHKGKLADGFTKAYGVTPLVHVETYGSILEARSRERSLKRWRREWKLKLIEELNPEWRDLADQISA